MRLLQRVTLGDCHAVTAFAWLPKENAVVTLLHDYSGSEPYDGPPSCHLLILDVGTSTWVHRVNMQPGLRVDCFTIDTDGHIIVVATEDGIRFWDVGRATWLSRQPLHIAYELADSNQLLAVLD